MDPAARLPTPEPAAASDPEVAAAWVARHLDGLVEQTSGLPLASPTVRGGQTAADGALAALDITGYARGRNEVWPPERRGATRLSPYVRHGLISLPVLWRAVASAPPRDRAKFRDELLWQEYARHVYARVGRGTGRALRYAPARGSGWTGPGTGEPTGDPGDPEDPWPRRMACLDLAVGELERDGWLVNQARMWLASQWTVRAGAEWREGEERFFRHLIDGSRAANRLGWQWTVGAGTGRPYGFSRWQVRTRAPGLCDRCPLTRDCPIEGRPDTPAGPPVPDEPAGLRRGDPGLGPGAGPSAVAHDRPPRAVWLTFESLGDDDPALAAHPDLPAVVVLDAPLLARLRLSAKRLVFVAETLADLGSRRDVEVYLGRPAAVLARRDVAVTFAPVPGFVRLCATIRPAQQHPWPWLARPATGPAQSFSAWRRADGAQAGATAMAAR